MVRLARTETPGLHTLATAVVDYRGHRVVAQAKPPPPHTHAHAHNAHAKPQPPRALAVV